MDAIAVMTWSLAVSGLMGAVGITLAAAGAHGRPGTGLDAAGYILLTHAAAVLGLATALDAEMLQKTLAALALAAFVLGSALFAGDVSLRVYRGRRLFPMAAPTGGMVLIFAWLLVGAAAVTSMLAAQ